MCMYLCVYVCMYTGACVHVSMCTCRHVYMSACMIVKARGQPRVLFLRHRPPCVLKQGLPLTGTQQAK